MASGFKVGTKDLDDIFDPYVEGTKPAATGFKVGTQDLRDRYAPRALGAQAAATGMKVGSADLNTLFAAKGTASYGLPIDGMTYSAYELILPGNTGSASVQFRITTTGVYYVEAVTTSGGAVQRATGSIVQSGASVSDYEVQFAVAHVSGATGSITNQASSYVKLTANFMVRVTIGPYGDQSGTVGSTYQFTIRIRRISTGQVRTAIFIGQMITDGSA